MAGANDYHRRLRSSVNLADDDALLKACSAGFYRVFGNGDPVERA